MVEIIIISIAVWLLIVVAVVVVRKLSLANAREETLQRENEELKRAVEQCNAKVEGFVKEISRLEAEYGVERERVENLRGQLDSSQEQLCAAKQEVQQRLEAREKELNTFFNK